jgi:long-chain acyl-CoA synthetase
MISRVYSADRAARIALLTDKPYRTLSYTDLTARVDIWREQMRRLPVHRLGWLVGDNSLDAVCAYLAALAENMPIGLSDAGSEQSVALVTTYAPTFLVHAAGADAPHGYRVAWTSPDGASLMHRIAPEHDVAPHPDLAVLLATSGSTGNAKVVRLSRANLEANAASITQYLELGPGEVAIQSLPMAYSYGLSLINSHLWAGGAVALTNRSFMRPEFWSFFDEARCTSFAGVPYVYETLLRLRWQPGKRASLRTLTQAGGHLKPDIVAHFHAATQVANQRFFVMYGQTEATARIAYVPPERLAEKRGSIGIAIPGGRIELKPVEDSDQRQMVYSGLNVMMGYAQEPRDLALGDVLGGVLPTGDLASCDAEGFHYITGRLSRFAKLFGRRVHLGDVEHQVEAWTQHPAAALEGDNRLIIFVECATSGQLDEVKTRLAEFLAVPPPAVQVESIDRLPMTASGKKNYASLRA